MNDQQLEYLMDVKDNENLSKCCGARTYGEYMICEECGEHC